MYRVPVGTAHGSYRVIEIAAACGTPSRWRGASPRPADALALDTRRQPHVRGAVGVLAAGAAAHCRVIDDEAIVRQQHVAGDAEDNGVGDPARPLGPARHRSPARGVGLAAET